MAYPARPLTPFPTTPPDEREAQIIELPVTPTVETSLVQQRPEIKPVCSACGYREHVMRTGDLASGKSILHPVSCEELQALRARVDAVVNRKRNDPVGWLAVWVRRVGWQR